MKNGFTFIEILVVMVMMGVLVVGGTVYFFRFSDKKSVEETASKIVGQIELARNNAKIRRASDSNSSEFGHVRVVINNGVIRLVNDLNYTYSTVNVSAPGVSVTNISGCGICFSAGDGKLINSSFVPIAVGDTRRVVVSSIRDISVTNTIVVDSAGMVSIE